jgi:hypothetical protein
MMRLYALFGLLLLATNTIVFAQEDTSPDSLDSNPGIHQGFKDLALETIDLIRAAEDELGSSDLIFKPARADADKSFGKLKRSVRTKGESSVRYSVTAYWFAVDMDRIVRNSQCTSCAGLRDKAIRTIKDSQIISEPKKQE